MSTKKSLTGFTLLVLAITTNLHAAKCSDVTLKGTFVYSSQGFIEVTPDVSPAGFVPWAQTGLAQFDGKGKISSGTFSAVSTTAGGGVNNGTFSGTYTINGDCSGAAIVTTNAGDNFHFDVNVQGTKSATFISNAGHEFLSIFSFQKIAADEKEPATTSRTMQQ